MHARVMLFEVGGWAAYERTQYIFSQRATLKQNFV
jgi:hypothetical protein